MKTFIFFEDSVVARMFCDMSLFFFFLTPESSVSEKFLYSSSFSVISYPLQLNCMIIHASVLRVLEILLEILKVYIILLYLPEASYCLQMC